MAIEVLIERSSVAGSVWESVLSQKLRKGDWPPRQGGFLSGLESLTGSHVAQSRDNEDKAAGSF